MSVSYQAFGLVIESEFPVPGGLPVRSGKLAPVDVSVRVGHTPESDGRLRLGPYSSAPGGVIFEHPTAARYFARADSHELVVEAKPGAGMGEIAGYLVATALPMVLWMRGELMLHASVGVFAGAERGVAFAGDSGSGKSTILRDVLKAGGSAMAEDSVCLRESRGLVVGSGLPGRVYGASAGLEMLAEREWEDLRVEQCRNSAGMGAVVLLQGEAESASVVRLPLVEAITALLQHRHRHRVPDMLGLSAGLLPRWATVASRVPVYAWTRGSGDVGAEVEALRAAIAI